VFTPRKHPQLPQQPFSAPTSGLRRTYVSRRARHQSPDVLPGVSVVQLFLEFIPRHRHLTRVDDDDDDVLAPAPRGVRRFIFPSQRDGDGRRSPAEDLCGVFFNRTSRTFFLHRWMDRSIERDIFRIFIAIFQGSSRLRISPEMYPSEFTVHDSNPSFETFCKCLPIDIQECQRVNRISRRCVPVPARVVTHQYHAHQRST